MSLDRSERRQGSDVLEGLCRDEGLFGTGVQLACNGSTIHVKVSDPRCSSVVDVVRITKSRITMNSHCPLLKGHSVFYS